MNDEGVAARFFAALKRGDQDQMSALLHPEFSVTEANGLPYGGIYRGADGWKVLCQSVVKTWKKFKIDLLELVVETDTRVVVRFSISGRSARTGCEFTSTVLELWRLVDGKIMEILPYYWDTQELFEAHGGTSPDGACGTSASR
jgi:ketosteroid isomerase-like protein